MSFKPGEKVQFKGSDLIMVVCRPRQLTVGGEPIREIEPGKVCCEWYDKVTGKHRTRFFDQETLELYKESKEEPKEEQKKDIGF